MGDNTTTIVVVSVIGGAALLILTVIVIILGSGRCRGTRRRASLSSNDLPPSAPSAGRPAKKDDRPSSRLSAGPCGCTGLAPGETCKGTCRTAGQPPPMQEMPRSVAGFAASSGTTQRNQYELPDLPFQQAQQTPQDRNLYFGASTLPGNPVDRHGSLNAEMIRRNAATSNSLPVQLEGQPPAVGGATELYPSKTSVSAGNLPTKKLFGFTRREKASPGYHIPNPGAPASQPATPPQLLGYPSATAVPPPNPSADRKFTLTSETSDSPTTTTTVSQRTYGKRHADAARVARVVMREESETALPPGYEKVLGTLHRVIKGYKPRLEDELELAVGDQIVVNCAYEDGWGRGINLTTFHQGAFPLTCVTSNALLDKILTEGYLPSLMNTTSDILGTVPRPTPTEPRTAATTPEPNPLSLSPVAAAAVSPEMLSIPIWNAELVLQDTPHVPARAGAPQTVFRPRNDSPVLDEPVIVNEPEAEPEAPAAPAPIPPPRWSQMPPGATTQATQAQQLAAIAAAVAAPSPLQPTPPKRSSSIDAWTGARRGSQQALAPPPIGRLAPSPTPSAVLAQQLVGQALDGGPSHRVTPPVAAAAPPPAADEPLDIPPTLLVSSPPGREPSLVVKGLSASLDDKGLPVRTVSLQRREDPEGVASTSAAAEMRRVSTRGRQMERGSSGKSAAAGLPSSPLVASEEPIAPTPITFPHPPPRRHRPPAAEAEEDDEDEPMAIASPPTVEAVVALSEASLKRAQRFDPETHDDATLRPFRELDARLVRGEMGLGRYLRMRRKVVEELEKRGRVVAVEF
ncbi:hypothetical protein HDU96_007608 [Phlyctochytrium bullatum]|nr:hypothetical protein HDU96_007608 [Phlyctochytrium bullatum]